MASTTVPVSSRSCTPFPATARMPVTLPFSVSSFVIFVPNRTSPPWARMVCRMCFTTFTRISVPICGFPSYKMDAGAPASTKIRSTSRFLPSLSFTSVFSFPSEKVPAPPSPNCALHSVSSTPSSQKDSTALHRSSTCRPRSKSTGR